MSSLRKPVMPATYNYRAPAGTCCFCAKPIRNQDGSIPKQKRWHSVCADLNKQIKDPSYLREKLWEREKGICQGCGNKPPHKYLIRWNKNYIGKITDGDVFDTSYAPVSEVFYHQDWQCDHIVPLHLVRRHLPEAFKYWTLDNAQLLCTPCHKAKSGGENKRRSKADRLADKYGKNWKAK